MGPHELNTKGRVEIALPLHVRLSCAICLLAFLDENFEAGNDLVDTFFIFDLYIACIN